MTILAHHLGSFLLEYLPRDRGVSQHTIDSYAYSFQLLVNYTANRYGIRPHAISIEHLTAQLILDFLNYLECERGNTARTRNARLAAYKSFFRYLEWRAPKCLEQIRQIHAIPAKKFDLALVDYLDRKEMQAILDTPDTNSVGGLRDRAMLHLVYAAGLRVSELIGLTMADFNCPTLDEVHVIGKGRRERVLPLWNETRAVLKNWLEVRPNYNTSAFFLNARGKAMSRHGFANRLSVHAKRAAEVVPTILRKNITPHVMRHSCAMHILAATGDIRKVSLWLGHSSMKTTEMYLRVDPAEKLDILHSHIPPKIRKGTFTGVSDQLLQMLKKART